MFAVGLMYFRDDNEYNNTLRQLGHWKANLGGWALNIATCCCCLNVSLCI